jgi:serine/threonine protein kinase
VNAPRAVDEVLDQLVDGGSVDWEAAERRAQSPEESALLRNLRILARLGDTHRITSPSRGADAPPHQARSVEETVEPSSQWGRYRLIRIIGQGSFGTVYLARDDQLDREVALKLLHPSVIASDALKAEGRALARIDHPNVLTVYGVEEHDGRLALCMKYVRGRTLDEIVRTDGPMNADEALVVAKAVCNAVAAVHAAGVLHRDIKARNVMRERNGRYVLMDFGAGVRVAPDGSAGREESVGTPLYMAPELLDGQPATRQSDVYAVGVLLYFLVTAEYPVSGSSVDEMKTAHRNARRVRLDDRRVDLPPAFVRAIDCATSPHVHERPETATALLRLLTADEVVAPPRPRMHRIVRYVSVTLALIVTITLLGALNTTWFNLMLERRSVADESPFDWFVAGLMSLVGPLSNWVQVLIAVYLISVVVRFLRRALPACDRVCRRIAEALRGTRRRLMLDEPETFAQVVFVSSVVYVAAICWWYQDLLQALMTTVSAMTAEQLAMFSPSRSFDRYLNYRNLLDYAVVGSAWGLYRLLRWEQRAARRVHPAHIIALTSVLVLSTVLWNGPYRVMFQSHRPRVEYAGQRCYNLGAAGAELLLFCPDAGAAKVRRVSAGDTRLRDTGITESVFTIP